MRARVVVTLKSGVLDPQGKAIGGALASLGIDGIASVRQGKIFDVELTANSPAAADTVLRAACEKLLANTVIENYRFEIDPGTDASAKRRPEGSPAQDGAAEDAEMPAEGHP